MNLTRMILLAAASLGMASAQAASDVVIVDFGDAAYTVYAGLPSERAEVAKRTIGGKPAEMMPFEQFSENAQKIIESRVARDDYPGQRVAEGVVALVKKYPGTPFGVTWNGGIAFTRNDYQAAKKAFELSKTPAGFTKPAPEQDAVAPVNHLKPLLGW